MYRKYSPQATFPPTEVLKFDGDTKGKKPFSEACLLYQSIYITFMKWWKYRDREQISGCQGLGVVVKGGSWM